MGNKAREALTVQTQESPPTHWEQWPGESIKAFEAFKTYRDLLHKRTFVEVARLFGCSDTNIRQWAVRWSWAERVEAYDRHLDQIDREEQVRARREMRRRQAQIGVQLQSLAMHGAATLQKQVDNKLPLHLEPGEIARLCDVGAKLERAARGEDSASEFSEITVVFERSTEDDPLD
jgi:hypothetical protein